MGKPSRRMPREDAVNLLKEGTYGVLSVATKEGIPYGVPINYFYVPEENAIYFHSLIRGRKLDFLKENNQVSFVVVANEKIMPERFVTHYDSVMLTGRASFLTDDGEKVKRLVQLCQALAPEATERRNAVIQKQLSAVAIVKIEIEEITGKRNRDE